MQAESIIKRLVPDERGRVTIGKVAGSVSSYQATYQEDGTIVLKPMAEIPAKEVWLWNNEGALASVRRGLEQSAAGRVKPLDLASLPADDE